MKRLVLYIAAFLILISCQEEDEIKLDGGELSLSISAQLSLNTKTDGELKSNEDIDISIFGIKIENTKGTILREWEKFSDVPSTLKFGVGKFVIKAHSGDSTAHGFDLPSFSGREQFTIAYAEKTDVNIICRHNKAVVSVKPEEGFYSYYKDFHTEVSSGSMPSLVYEKDEIRKGYLVVGDINAKIYITRKDGTKLEAVMPTIEGVKAADHYTIGIKVGSSGSGSIDVTVTKMELEEIVLDIEVPLSAISGKAPFYTATGFSLESPRIGISESISKEIKLLIKAGATIDECVCTIKSAFLIEKGLPSEFDFTRLNEDPVLANQIEALGIKWSKTMRGNTMGEIDFSDFVANLPAREDKFYEHHMTITVRDYINRTTEPLPMVFVVNHPVMQIVNIGEIEKTDNDTKLNITFSISVVDGEFDILEYVCYGDGTNFIDIPKNDAIIKDPVNNIQEIKISNIPFKTSYPLKLKYRTTFGLRESDVEYVFVATPKFTISEPTAITETSMSLTVAATETDEMTGGYDHNKLKVYIKNQGSWEKITEAGSSYDEISKSKIFLLNGLTPSEKYLFKTNYNDLYNSYNYMIATTKGFTFEETWVKKWEERINSGGRYGMYNLNGSIGKNVTQDKETIVCNDLPENSSWKTSNDLTAKQNSNPKNTWFISLSAFSENLGRNGKCVRLRSTAYSHGTLNVPDKIEGYSWFNDPTSKSDVPRPDFIPANNYTAGTISTTLKLRSRPYSVSGFYKYTPTGDDKGSVTVTAYGINEEGQDVVVGSNKVLFHNSITAWSDFEVIINYTQPYKVTKLEIVCSSSNNTPTEQQLKFHTTTNPTNATGSELYIDDINLKY